MVRRWTATEETALRQLKEECQKYQEEHSKDGTHKNKWRLLLASLIVVLSVAAGAVNFAVDNGDANRPRPGLKYSVGAVNFCTAAVTWLSSKLNMGKRVESHKAAAKSYATLIRNIDLELSTHRRDRTTSGATFLHVCIEQMNKILEEAPELKQDDIAAKINLT